MMAHCQSRRIARSPARDKARTICGLYPKKMQVKRGPDFRPDAVTAALRQRAGAWNAGGTCSRRTVAAALCAAGARAATTGRTRRTPDCDGVMQSLRALLGLRRRQSLRPAILATHSSSVACILARASARKLV